MSCIKPFPNKPLFLRVCSTSLLKTLWEKEELNMMRNLSFSHIVFCFFSSPEHKVLMVSYCDRAVSVVRCRPSSTFYLVYPLEATFSVQSSWNLARMFVSINYRTSSKLGHVGSKTRSLGQILEKPCVRRPHFLSDPHETWSECLSW